MLTDNIISFLVNRLWYISEETDRFVALRPPEVFNVNDDFRIHIPKQTNKVDSERFVENILEIVADFYDLTVDDLNVVLKNESTVLKVRVYDDQTEEGRMPLTRFEELVERVRSILSDTASFVIDRSVTSTRVPGEVSRYLSLCNFMQTEKGSFIAKIQLPSKELIKERELFDRAEILSEEINLKLNEVLNFVNEDIFEGNPEITEDYLLENETRINLKLLKDIESFFDKAKLRNIDFSFHSVASSKTIISQNITPLKLHRLNQFVERIESHSFEIGDFSFTGHIIALKSKDPDGLKNSVTFSGIHDNLPIVANANLNSEHYKDAIEAHKLKQNITVKGLAKRTKSRARFIEVVGFEIEE